MRLTLTKQAEYALRILVWVAGQEAAERAEGAAPARRKAAKIAAATTVPPGFATRVLALLQRYGLLRARAGQQGGYTLARPASTVSLLEVIEAVEGPLATRDCVMRDGLCGAGGDCLLHDAWMTAQHALRDVLAATSLASALAHGAEVRPRLGSELLSGTPSRRGYPLTPPAASTATLTPPAT